MKLNGNPHDLVKIENPVYQSYEKICKDFFGKTVLITKINHDERKRILGGIVTYYTVTNKEIYDKWDEECNTPDGADGEKCKVRGLFPRDYYGITNEGIQLYD